MWVVEVAVARLHTAAVRGRQLLLRAAAVQRGAPLHSAGSSAPSRLPLEPQSSGSLLPQSVAKPQRWLQCAASFSTAAAAALYSDADRRATTVANEEVCELDFLSVNPGYQTWILSLTKTLQTSSVKKADNGAFQHDF